jgi:hypothetical protein
MKPGSIGDPEVYLGATIKQMCLANGIMAWASSTSSPSKYVQASVDAVTKYLTNLGNTRWSMPKKAANPFPGDYEPELDTTPTPNPELSLWYASLIEMLRWMGEIGQVDIITEVSKMASHMASPWEGHLDALMHILGFLRINHYSWMVYDPLYPTIDMNVFKPNNWQRQGVHSKQHAGTAWKGCRPTPVYQQGSRWGEAHVPFAHGLLCLHEHCTRAVVLEATDHNRNLSF